MPTRSRHRSACSAVTAIFTPKASSTSALPHWLVALRLPCLATVTPAAAATMADPVEMLNVFEKSPPVPQVSMAPGGAATGTAAARMARAKPRISSSLSPFIRSAVSRAASRAGDTSPAMTAAMTPSASAASSEPPSTILFSASVIIAPLRVLPSSGSW